MAGMLAFIWDGIFIGMTATRGMLVSSFLSALVFFAVYGGSKLFTFSLFTNHFLWLAQIIYLAMRGILQTIWYRLRLINTI
jgi:MATE family multidrug resistance protein